MIVTATTDPFKTATWWKSWRANVGDRNIPIVMVVNGIKDRFNVHEEGWIDTLTNNTGYGLPGDALVLVDDYLGVVPAFDLGSEVALRSFSPTIVACLHDDVEILEDNWDLVVLDHFQRHPWCALVGFGGALGVGLDGMYDEGVAYRPQMLGRRNFGSNMTFAHDHGERWTSARQVAVIDGFSMIFRAEWLDFAWRWTSGSSADKVLVRLPSGNIQDLPVNSNLFTLLSRQGVIHHAYDVAISRLVAHGSDREVWYLPIKCHHAGGQTAVGDPGYQEWAKAVAGGDQSIWERSHEIVYSILKGALPYSVPDTPPTPPAPKPDVLVVHGVEGVLGEG